MVSSLHTWRASSDCTTGAGDSMDFPHVEAGTAGGISGVVGPEVGKMRPGRNGVESVGGE